MRLSPGMSIPRRRGMVESKLVSGSTLALLQARIFFVDDVNTALPADDLAVRSAAFDGSANSHDFIS